MKTISFIKMNGAGNDFIIIQAQKRLNYKKLAIVACNRTDGVGADGLIILDKSKKADYKMRIINADSSEAEMCGNGVRCLAAYILKEKKERKKTFSIETLSGIILARKTDKKITVRLSDPKNYTEDIILSIDRRPLKVSYIDTGVPHTICFVQSLESIDVNRIGRKVRFDKKFAPRGTNVNFVEQVQRNLVNARTYERGVEAETRACGTGSVAAAIVAFLKANPTVESKKNALIKVKTKSGEILDIRFDFADDAITNVWLTGSAKFIAEGKFLF